MPHQETEFYQAMLQAVSTTLENMAFVEVSEQAGEVPAQLPEDPAWVSILIHDPMQGELRLAMPQSLLTAMTANMFGLEVEEVVEGQKNDIIAEILNTLAGLFLTKFLPDDQTYQLGLPEHGEGDFPESEEGTVVWNLLVERQPLLLVASGAGLVSGNR